VKIPAEVYVQIQRIRRSGVINMYDRRGVQSVANRRGFYAAVLWLHDNVAAYGRGLHEGFEPHRLLTEEECISIEEEGAL
jgi:hypothetical protein